LGGQRAWRRNWYRPVPGVAELFLAPFEAFLLKGERLVKDETAGAGEAAQLARLFAVGTDLVSKGLVSLHAPTLAASRKLGLMCANSARIGNGRLWRPRYPSPP
jgi:hypothetical protein